MMILVRDAAIEPHPVIGIAALSSPIVQQSERDRIIGWDSSGILRAIQDNSSRDLAEWLIMSLAEMIAAVKWDDLASKSEIDNPSDSTIARLIERSEAEKKLHQLHAHNTGYRRQQEESLWAELVDSHLYISKRAVTLAELLRVKREFAAAGLVSADAELLRLAIKNSAFRRAVGRLVRGVKASRVGINMMDISVAGAIAPYNAILGGKLVSLLLTSPEVTAAYSRRYGSRASVIASSMKGCPVVRDPKLVLLCTTGLFGGGSSQYNRLRMSTLPLTGNGGEIRFIRLESETTFATFHISQATMRELDTFSNQWHDGSNIHGIFGEGVNPKMRKLREGLTRAGFPPEEILQAGTPRTVYMVPLAHNYKDVLLGRSNVPDYILKSDNPGQVSDSIAEFWRQRWLAGRVEQPAVIRDVATHSTNFPLIHGASVRLPDCAAGELAFDFDSDGELAEGSTR
jgi:hypothetical protein